MVISNVSVDAKANIYFEGRVISHTVTDADGSRKTVGVILPGTYHFGTGDAERMEIIQGDAEVVQDGSEKTGRHVAGETFLVPANSGFTVTVKSEPCHYICSFLKA
jgi:uncharacterized protein YaiE (UPF0345 family)